MSLRRLYPRISSVKVVLTFKAPANALPPALRAAALADPRVGAVLSAAEVEAALDPASYLGSADALVDRALADFERLRGRANQREAIE